MKDLSETPTFLDFLEKDGRISQVPPKIDWSWGATPPPDSAGQHLPPLPTPLLTWLDSRASDFPHLSHEDSPSARKFAVKLVSFLKTVLMLAAGRVVFPPSPYTHLKSGSIFLKVIFKESDKIFKKSPGFSPRRIRKSYYRKKVMTSPSGPVHCFS